MKSQMKDILPSILITLVLLIFFEVISSAFIPIFGIKEYKLPFHLLIVLHLGLKLRTPYIAVLILVIQYFHSFFSVEGWEMGTIAGVIICVTISYLKDLIHLSSIGITILIVQLFQLQWLVIVSLLIYMKGGDAAYLTDKFWHFVPESIVISILAPFLFIVFDKIWSIGETDFIGEQG
ncbi:MAG: hypothetical protein HN509_18300 [Halobacteriovoraceae bacterium]|nr:hypothetical protein [Halobacteriovoraceae bacterium]